jgi:hypothetical protein
MSIQSALKLISWEATDIFTRKPLKRLALAALSQNTKMFAELVSPKYLQPQTFTTVRATNTFNVD